MSKQVWCSLHFEIRVTCDVEAVPFPGGSFRFVSQAALLSQGRTLDPQPAEGVCPGCCGGRCSGPCPPPRPQVCCWGDLSCLSPFQSRGPGGGRAEEAGGFGSGGHWAVPGCGVPAGLQPRSRRSIPWSCRAAGRSPGSFEGLPGRKG